MGSSKFSQRWDQPEIMDDLEFAGEEMDQALKELEKINKWLGGNAVTLSGLNMLHRLFPEQKVLSIADLGCGGGDMLMLIADWGRRKGLDLKLTGIDANPYIIDYASRHSQEYPEISYQAVNIFNKDFQDSQFDIVTSTLFTHHFNSEDLSELLAVWQKQSRLGVVINDLHRHWLAYYSIIGITRMLSNSTMVKNDGPVSVLRAFHKNDWKEILHKQGIKNYQLQWRWAFRWLLVIPHN